MAPRRVAFVVMPYRVKDVAGAPRPGVPTRIDFDALWDRAIRPALERLGYQAVRGDADPAGVILVEMMERLAFADLVLGDVTIPNGNAYYEIGVRHAAFPTNCVLMAAEWSEPLFDLNQVPAIRYPLATEQLDDAAVQPIIDKLCAAIPRMSASRTPFHEFVRGGSIEERRRGVFRDYVDRLSDFQAGVRAVRIDPDGVSRMTRLRELVRRSAGEPLRIAAVVGELVPLVRDVLGWAAVIELVALLPPETRSLHLVEEQRILATAKGGAPLEAVAELEGLIAARGKTPERCGLVGGRYKALWSAELAARRRKKGKEPGGRERQYLDRAITAYEEGAHLDLNAFYCSSNLPLLLLARGKPGDRERSVFTDQMVRLQCERAVAMGTSDEWVPFTLLGVALRLGELAEVARLVERIELAGAIGWQVDSAWGDLAESVGHVESAKARTLALRALKPIDALRGTGD